MKKRREQRWKLTDDNMVVMDIKDKIIDILDTIMKIQDNKRLTLFLVQFCHRNENNTSAKEQQFIEKMTKAMNRGNIREQ